MRLILPHVIFYALSNSLNHFTEDEKVFRNVMDNCRVLGFTALPNNFFSVKKNCLSSNQKLSL